MLSGSLTPKILVVNDFLRVTEKCEHKPFAGKNRELLESYFYKSNINVESEVGYTVLWPFFPRGGSDPKRITVDEKSMGYKRLIDSVRDTNPNLIVTLGTHAFKAVTGIQSTVDKYQLSICKSRAEFGGRKVIPILHPQSLMKSYSDIAYISAGASKISGEYHTKSIDVPDRDFLLSPPFTTTIEYLNDVCLKSNCIGVDLEFANGQINTVGFAPTKTSAIAINVLPDRLNSDKYHTLWKAIKKVAESDIPKTAQNAIIETQWFSKYGVWLNNIIHDTMWCNKFLHPELEMGLQNVGRLYTPFPYWKDDVEFHGNIKNWQSHYEYNCKDTTGTLWAMYEQQQELQERGLSKLFYEFVMCFFPCIREMCSNGLPVNEYRRKALEERLISEIEAIEEEVNSITLERTGRTCSTRSKFFKDILKDMGFKLPVVRRKDGTNSETMDKKALAKLAKKYKKEPIFKHLRALSTKNKLLSSYVKFQYDDDQRVRYSLNGCATETGRWNSKLDPFGHGFNAQTIPKSVKHIFNESGKYLMQIDLAQAESRYVAWEAPELTLMQLILDQRDIHKFVASKIFKVEEKRVTTAQRQLGKKSGHGANYGVGPRTFAESCFVDMGIELTQIEAQNILNGYFEVFPGIRRRQYQIQETLRRQRKIITPLGRERFFFGRMNDQTFREAYAYAPQSTIPDITNTLMLFLCMGTKLLLQGHDSLLLEVESYSQAKEIAEMARSYDDWHPDIQLAGGKLVIPVDCEWGEDWKHMEAL